MCRTYHKHTHKECALQLSAGSGSAQQPRINQFTLRSSRTGQQNGCRAKKHKLRFNSEIRENRMGAAKRRTKNERLERKLKFVEEMEKQRKENIDRRMKDVLAHKKRD